MPRSAAFHVENNFTRGLITETTGLNTPENASTDTDNCRFDEDGTVRRRKAIDIETSGTLTVPSATEGVIREYVWNAAGNSGTRSFLVVQFGSGVSFFQADDSGNYAGGEKSFGVTLTSYATWTAPELHTFPCSFTSGNGRLFLAHRDVTPLAIEYDEETDNISITPITIEVRDLEGVDDGLENDERPTTLSALHEYNLTNQSWNRDKVVENAHGSKQIALDYWDSIRADFPANNEMWWYYKDANDQLEVGSAPDKAHYGNSPAPKGHWIYNAFDLDRNVKTDLTGIPGESTDRRPSQIAFYAGRVWYSGVDANDFTQKVYYSQIIEGPTQFGKCYQRNDPTSEELSDLLDSDGGRVSILDMGEVVNMAVVQDALLLFSTEGVWSISGGDGTGFLATDFNVRKLSSTECTSPYTFVDVDGLPVWWNYEGIYAVSPGDSNQLQIISLSDTTIKTFFQDILANSRYHAKGAYDPRSKEIQWIYRSDAATTTVDNFKYDRMLVFNTTSKAFYPWSTTKTLYAIAGIFVADSSYVTTEPANIIGNFNTNVLAGVDEVIVTTDVTTQADTAFKYITCVIGQGLGEGSGLPFGEEVAVGNYNLPDSIGHPAYDFVNRLYYRTTNTDGGTIYTYSMVDHSLISSVVVTWNSGFGGFDSGPNYIHTDGLFYSRVNAPSGFGTGYVAINLSTGVQVSTNHLDEVILNPSYIVIFNVAGVTHAASLKFSGLTNWRYSFWKHVAGVWTELGQTYSIAGSGVNDPHIVGVKEEAGSSTFYHYDEAQNLVYGTTIDTAGTLTGATKWSGLPALTETYYLADEGNLLLRNGATVSKYSFDDGLFTQIWENTSALQHSSEQVMNWYGPLNPKETIGFARSVGLTISVLDIETGVRLCSLTKNTLVTSNRGHWWDEVGGSLWYSNVNNEFWRHQVDCNFAGLTGGVTFGGEAPLDLAGESDYTDWKRTDGTGTDYCSYFLTGAKVHADGMRDFNSNYVSVFSENETNSSCLMHGRWDWSRDTTSAEFSTPQQVYTNRPGRDVQRRRLKVRGSGPALQLYFKSESGKPFNIIGWAIFETAENQP